MKEIERNLNEEDLNSLSTVASHQCLYFNVAFCRNIETCIDDRKILLIKPTKTFKVGIVFKVLISNPTGWSRNVVGFDMFPYRTRTGVLHRHI